MLAALIEVAHGDWGNLYRCSKCDQLWAIDDYDRLRVQVAVALASAVGWEGADTTDVRKALLLQHRGGASSDACMWAGCVDDQVKGVVYCIEHLWSTGIRI